ncbi:MAG: bifunctional adenosylcobinamide kinase/adenosylcobinamide-phosphate guanylyltransferase, partial [Loktanella sp.]|nr:bifunctional adenosylcobinamide kinase/adenosylcobinamide-phosphate guanylyltransferase [Loktanella sp.]
MVKPPDQLAALLFSRQCFCYVSTTALLKESSRKMLPPLTFILGGAASGKSKIAENLVISTGRPRVYLATAQAFDDEMKTKVAAHLT